jgi:hypothetical protein
MYWLTVVASVLILSLIVYLSMSYAMAAPQPAPVSTESEYSLAGAKPIMSSEALKKVWVGTNDSMGGGATLLFFIWPQIIDRTAVSGNEYATALTLGNRLKFKILIAPDAGRSEGFSPAILEIFAKGDSKPVVIDVANVPLQRWSQVAIVKQGRKFTVYVNGKMASSTMLTKMPDFDDTAQLVVGDKKMTGKIALVSLTDYPMTSGAIYDNYRQSADADGKPYLASALALPAFTFANLTTSCPGGDCVKKPGPMEEWSTPVA